MENTKKTIATIASILILTFSAMFVALPTVNAADVTTNAFLAVSPNPVGVNQEVVVIIWLAPIQPTSADVLHDFTVLITEPDGNTETIGPMDSWSMGGQSFTYTPTSVGNYTLKFMYPGETFSSTGDVYLPSESPITTLVVQQEPIPPYPETPLPTDYWTRPINSEKRNWASISGNWQMVNYNSTYRGFSESISGFNPYSQAPRSPHIMWTKELELGGLTGGEYGSTGFYSGQSYETYFTPPIIMGGKLYYRIYRSVWGDQSAYPGFVCVDLRTGEELWRNEEGNIDIGQLWNYISPNQQGIIPLLWDITGDTWDVYNAFTGELAFSFGNAQTTMVTYGGDSKVVFGDDGTMFVYILNGFGNWMAMWNSTKAFEANWLLYSFTPGVLGGFYAWQDTFDWTLGVEWNVTIPDRIVTGVPNVLDPSITIAAPRIATVTGDVMTAKVGDGGNNVVYELAYNLTTGQELWVKDDPVKTWLNTYGDGIYASFSLQTMKWTAYDVKTGKQLWVSEPGEYPWGSYTNYVPTIANGKLYSGSFSGYLQAFNITTGQEVWKFYSGDSGRETITGSWPFWNGPIIADGVIFASTGEETPTQPLTRGNRLFAIDEETGEEIWNISGYMSLRAIADGYLIAYNGYDNLAYCFGKGPTQTTVTAPDMGVPQGSSVVIRGTVMDICAGASQEGVIERFPNGLPAVADESMSEWMEYVYMQQVKPEDAEGVKVFLKIQDPNGDYYGTYVTTDENGRFSHMWAPSIAGEYKVTAMFEGSESYYPSQETTYFGVSGGITAEEIAQKVLDELPDSPSAGDIAGAIINQLPKGLSAQDVADKVLANLPEGPSAEDVAQEILNQLAEEPEAPLITTEQLIITVVVIAIVIATVSFYLLRRRRRIK